MSLVCPGDSRGRQEWSGAPAALVGMVALALWVLASCAPADYIVLPLFELRTAPVQWDESQATAFLPAACVCMRHSQDPAENKAAIEAYVTRIRAEHSDVRLILFSETALGWYIKPDEPVAYQKRIAEPQDGPTMAFVKALAASNALYIGYGYGESDGEALYNSFALIDPSGALIANHRKMYLAPGMDDVDGFLPGDQPTTAYVDGIKVGLQICMDLSSTALAQSYSQDPDIKIILSPLADANGAPPAFSPVRLRHVWFLFANRIGVEGSIRYPGWYGIYDPAGCPKSFSEGTEGYLYYRVGVVL